MKKEEKQTELTTEKQDSMKELTLEELAAVSGGRNGRNSTRGWGGSAN